MGKHFFMPEERNGDIVTFTDARAHHLGNVLRLRPGQEIILCDGMETDYIARAELLSRSQLKFSLFEAMPTNTELPIPITLVQGLPKGDKMDWIIEKAVELGVSRIIPVYTEHTVVKLNDAAQRKHRFERIAVAAASQSMRGIIPVIDLPTSFENVAYLEPDNLCLVAHEKETTVSIKSVLASSSPRPISLWIGPEGGFSSNEIDELIKKNAITVTLGPRILRSETAGLAALAQITSSWDFCVFPKKETD
ncbi:MAG: 16S rRNA (uracil(1498)-N(3))-methyltransferase [Defluviitaleaceae bacterium]|nr:16S rRNA (uracil(1498)-N(3))-methyltransferase [Defluviitaleaceae bacterium]